MAVNRTAKRLLLGREIQHMLNTQSPTWSQAEAARFLETSQSKIAALIAGQAVITIGDLEKLATKLGFTDPGYIIELLELRRDSGKRGAWTTGHNRAYHEDFRLMVDLERKADLIRCVASESMPGLAQSETYVRALFEGYVNDEGISTEDFIQARLARQQVLLGDDPPHYRVIMSESCLRREHGGATVMREQLNYLIKLSKQPNVQLQVIPFKASLGSPSMLIPFAFVRVPSRGYAGPLELAYIEGFGETRYLDTDKALHAYDNAWARLSAHALNSEETRKFLRHIANTFR